MSRPPSVAAVVVSFNGGAALHACIESLLSQELDGLEIIVVDNASSDDSIDRLANVHGTKVRIIRRATNGGYAAGANAGWRAARGELVAILNQDLKLRPDCLARMREVLLGCDREALVTPKLVLESDPRRVNAIGNEVHLSGVAWCHGLGTLADDWHGVVDVTAISGAAFMAQRRLLESLGGLEEELFMYYEDVDLSLRARVGGATCLAACDAVAAHDWRLDVSQAKFERMERNRMAVWRRLWAREPRMLLPLAQAEAMAWLYAALRGSTYAHAKWRASRSPIRLAKMPRAPASLRSRLSAQHPYSQLFPNQPLVAWIGSLVDRVVAGAILPKARGTEPPS